LRSEFGASETEVVCAATIAPVSSKEHSFSVMAARIVSLCHSYGIASARTQSVQ